MEPTCFYEFVVNDERAFISESGSKIILGRSSEVKHSLAALRIAALLCVCGK